MRHHPSSKRRDACGFCVRHARRGPRRRGRGPSVALRAMPQRGVHAFEEAGRRACSSDIAPEAMSAGCACSARWPRLGHSTLVSPAIRSEAAAGELPAPLSHYAVGPWRLDRARRAMAAGRRGVRRGHARLHVEGRARNEIAATPPYRHGMDLRVRGRLHATPWAATAPATSTKPTRPSSMIRWWTPSTAAFAWWRCKVTSSCRVGSGG